MARPKKTTTVNMVGVRCGKLLVVEQGPSIKYRTQSHATWVCLCECGNVGTYTGHSLRQRLRKSCGCLYRSGKEATIYDLYSHYRMSADRRGYAFDISEDIFEQLVTSFCVYCGLKATENKLIGVDRIDSGKGYVMGNCEACCSICNRAKGILSKEQFLNLAKRIYERNFS